jgi:hypothetical protein
MTHLDREFLGGGEVETLFKLVLQEALPSLNPPMKRVEER